MRHALDTQPTERSSNADNSDSDFEDRQFLNAHDVAMSARHGEVLTGRPRCESWHLDREGRFTCGTRATARDSLARWSADPHRLIDAFVAGRPERTCTPIWVMVDERPTRGSNSEEAVNESDAEQFLRLQRQLEVAGITLVDCVVFDDRRHWWSMTELLTGSTDWVYRSMSGANAA